MVKFDSSLPKHLATSVLACILLFSAIGVHAQEQSHRYMARVVPTFPDLSPKLLFAAVNEELGGTDFIHDRDHGLLIFNSEALLSFAQVSVTVGHADFILLQLAQDDRDRLSYLNASTVGPVPIYNNTGQAEQDMAEYKLAIDTWRIAYSAPSEITE